MMRPMILVVVVCLGNSLSSAYPTEPSPARQSRSRRALIVGVTTYPSLGEPYQLTGPANDVLLMRDLLLRKFSFSPDLIRILSEEGGQADVGLLPTRQNIERAFAELARETHRGDDVVIFLSGHGAQQPEQPGKGPPELDGLDEIFLPSDVAQWESDGTRGHVPNAITDNEFGQWLTAIRAKGAHLWVVLDCCHSGDMTRGFGEIERFVPAEDREGLAIPTEVLANVRAQARLQNENWERPLSSSRFTPGSVDAVDLDDMAIVYACQSHEKTIEDNLPAAESKRYGLLTYSLNAVLAKTSGPLSYEELGKWLHFEYINLGHPSSPTPLIEGGDSKRAVLGQQTITRPLMTVKLDELTHQLGIDAGSLHGITVNSVLAVYSPLEDSQSKEAAPIGYVTVTNVDMATAEVTPCKYNDTQKKRRKHLNGGRCKVIERDFGDLKIKVAVDRTDFAGNRIQESLQQQLQQLVDTLAEEDDTLVAVAAKPAQSNWFVRLDSNAVYLVPKAEWTRKAAMGNSPEAKSRETIFGPFPVNEELLSTLRTSLNTIARAHNLLCLATAEAGAKPADTTGVNMKIELRRLSMEREGSEYFQPGDRVQFMVTNTGRLPFDLTALYVDSQMGISALFPVRGVLNRLQPQERPLMLPPATFGDETLGREHIVFLAVHTDGPPVSLSSLAQPRVSGVKRGDAPHSGLAAILAKGLNGRGKTRSIHGDDLQSYAIDVISVNVEPRGDAANLK